MPAPATTDAVSKELQEITGGTKKSFKIKTADDIVGGNSTLKDDLKITAVEASDVEILRACFNRIQKNYGKVGCPCVRLPHDPG